MLGLQGVLIDRDPAGVVGEAGIPYHLWRAVGRHGDQQVEGRWRAVLEAQLATLRSGKLPAWVVGDAFVGQHSLDCLSGVRAGHGHGRRLRGVESQLYVVAHMALVEVAFQQHRPLVGRCRALEGKAGHHQGDAPSLERGQGVVQALSACQVVVAMRIGQAGHGVRGELRAQRYDERVIADLPSVDGYRLLREVDAAQLAGDDLDAFPLQPGDVSGDRLGLAFAGHHPQVGRREGLLQVPLDEDDTGSFLQPALQLAGGNDAAHAASQHHDRLFGHRSPPARPVQLTGAVCYDCIR